MTVYDGALYLTGPIGDVLADGSPYVSEQDVRRALAKHGSKPLTVFINSYGGHVNDGLAIHNALKTHSGPVTVIIDGIAASIASIIAMAGSEIVMRRGSTMMIHEPHNITFGDAAAHRAGLQSLDAMANEMAKIYAARAGLAEDKVRQLMIAETWFTPEEAVAKGFATRVDGLQSKMAAWFNYGKVFAHAPANLLADIERGRRKSLIVNTVSRTNARRVGKSPTPVSKPAAEPKPVSALAKSVAKTNAALNGRGKQWR